MGTSGSAASVVALWRYPVKSLQGEPVAHIEVGSEGLEGDRRFAIFDRETGMGVTGRRSPSLLFASARLLPDGNAEITLPDGRISEGDEDLSAWLERPVTLRRADVLARGVTRALLTSRTRQTPTGMLSTARPELSTTLQWQASRCSRRRRSALGIVGGFALTSYSTWVRQTPRSRWWVTRWRSAMPSLRCAAGWGAVS